MILKLDKQTLSKVKKLWPDNWENIIKFYNNKKENFNNNALYIQKNIIEKMGENPIENELIKKIRNKEYVLEYEQEILKKIIPKNQLENGAIYIGTGCNLSRYVDKARWDEKEGLFFYSRTKYGHTFEDTMEHFSDVKNSIAGFTPLTKIE